MRGRWHEVGVITPPALAALFLVCACAGVRFNTSGSLPVGLYITTTASAALVEFCPAEPFASLAMSRGYRAQGSCPDGAMPLVKPIVAQAGDVVDFSTNGIMVNGRLLPNTVPFSVDSRGLPLQPWTFGHYRVAPGTIWVASSYSPRSFDSRYFGPVLLTAIRKHVRPLLTIPE